MSLHLRGRSLRAVAGAVAVGVSMGALVGFGVASSDSPPPPDNGTDQMHQQMVDGDGPDMAAMHEETMTTNPEMARRHEETMQANPGMARMHDQMMEDDGGGVMGGGEMPSMDHEPPG